MPYRQRKESTTCRSHRDRAFLRAPRTILTLSDECEREFHSSEARAPTPSRVRGPQCPRRNVVREPPRQWDRGRAQLRVVAFRISYRLATVENISPTRESFLILVSSSFDIRQHLL